VQSKDEHTFTPSCTIGVSGDDKAIGTCSSLFGKNSTAASRAASGGKRVGGGLNEDKHAGGIFKSPGSRAGERGTLWGV
jgi:hypothetical protein